MYAVICAILLILLFSLTAKQKSFQHEKFQKLAMSKSLN